MMLLVSGMEVDLSVIVRQGRTALYVSLTGVIMPFAIGFGLARLLPWLLPCSDWLKQSPLRDQ